MKRYYVHSFGLHDAILLDRVEKTWTFFKTNVWGQAYNLEQQPNKVSKQRINGLIRRLNGRTFDSLEGFVVDPLIYHYIFTEEQRATTHRALKLNEEPLSFGDDLEVVLREMCDYFIEQGNDKGSEIREFYQVKIREILENKQ